MNDWQGRGLRLEPVRAADIGESFEPAFAVWRGNVLIGYVMEQAPWGWWGITATNPSGYVSRPPTREQAIEDLAQEVRPPIVCLCGSTRFLQAFQDANLAETLAGRIVLSIGCDTKQDHMLGLTAADKERLDEIHRRKLDLCDEVLVLNCQQYIGESTRREVAYATWLGKPVRYLKPVLTAPQHDAATLPEMTETAPLPGEVASQPFSLDGAAISHPTRSGHA